MLHYAPTGMGHTLIREASFDLSGTRLYAESVGHQRCVHCYEITSI